MAAVLMCVAITDISMSTDNGNSTIRYQWTPTKDYSLDEATVCSFYDSIEGNCNPGTFKKDTVEGSDKNLVLMSKSATLGLDGKLSGESQWRTVSKEEAYFGMPVINFRVWSTTVSQDSIYLGLAYCKNVVDKLSDVGVDAQSKSPDVPITATNGQTFDDMPQNVIITATHSLNFNLCENDCRIAGLMSLNGTINSEQITLQNATIAKGTGLISVQTKKELWKHELTGETGFYNTMNIEIRHNPLGFWAIIPNTGTFKWESSRKVPIANNPQTLSVVTKDGRGYLNCTGDAFVDVCCSLLLYFQMYPGNNWDALKPFMRDSSTFPNPKGWKS